MNASATPPCQEGRRPWLLLIHHLPPKPDYLRVKIRRRLHGLGASMLKSTVYALPDSEDAREDFEWLIKEIEAAGGSAVLCRAEFLAGITDLEIEAMRESDSGTRAADEPVEAMTPGRTWITRQGVKVDRIASAWLIARFIDREARFRFVPATGYQPLPGELRFDMFDGEYTHEGEHCTFQTLLARFGLTDPALAAMGEIIHDIDCKDVQFHRTETDQVTRSIEGLVATTPGDEDRLARGRVLFDDLYASLQPRS